MTAGVQRFYKLGIVGWPLGYSLSPEMHRAALEAAGLAGEYREYPVPPDKLVGWLGSDGARLDGFNVTMPHKSAVWSWLKSRGGAARLDPFLLETGLDAVNTVAMQEGLPVGYNTDGEGFLRPLTEPPRRLTLAGWRGILLGSGGSAKAIATALALKTKVHALTVWNRPSGADRAEDLARRLNRLRGAEQFALASSDSNQLPMGEGHLLINATPMGMKGQGEVPDGVAGRLHHGMLVVDIVYEPRETQLIRAARAAGCAVVAGDEMLAGQGAASFEIWTGVPVARVLPIMKRVLGENLNRYDVPKGRLVRRTEGG